MKAFFRSCWRAPLAVPLAEASVRRPAVATTSRYLSSRKSSLIHTVVSQPLPRSNRPLPLSSSASRAFHSTPKRPLRSNYSRASAGIYLLRRWVQSPTFLYQVGGISVCLGAVYITNLETVPVSGRRRFNLVTPSMEAYLSASMRDQVLGEFQGRVLPEYDPRVRMVRRVLDRLAPNSGLEGQEWQVAVIQDDKQTNAFVIPGGSVFVFTGILPVCGGEDGLAAVLGHEIAHNVAHHTGERMTQAGLVAIAALALFYLLGVGDEGRLLMDLVYSRPGSRAQEAEADYIGLMIMAKSCFDPAAAVGLWERMDDAEQVKVPQFMSTHPSSHNRMEKIREWLPKAEEVRDDSGCAMTAGYKDQFQKTVRGELW